MCGSKPKVDTSYQDQMLADAEAARIKEEERQGRIRTGTGEIDSTFAQFDDSFFDGFKNNIMGYYQPQLDDQFGDANESLTFSHARRGTLNSSDAAKGRADLDSAYTDALAGVLSEANGQVDGLRNQVTGEKNSLVSMLNATGDSQRAASEATARSSNLFASQPKYNPLGDVFAGLTQGWASAKHGQQQQDIWGAYTGGANNGGNSSRIIGG